MDRRGLVRTGLTFAAGALAATLADDVVGRGRSEPAVSDTASAPAVPPATSAAASTAPATGPARLDDWEAVRAQFNLTPDFLHFGGLYIASHPEPVRAAIERHRAAMDANPVVYLQDEGGRLEATVLRAAAA